VNREVAIFGLRDLFLCFCLWLQIQSQSGHPGRRAYAGAVDAGFHPADSSRDNHRQGDILYFPSVSYTAPPHHTACGATTMERAQLGRRHGMETAFVLVSETSLAGSLTPVILNRKRLCIYYVLASCC
jgi:hypothetical protein